jgi:hypothetical protein
MRLYEVLTGGVLYHATDMRPALSILRDGGIHTSYDDIDHDRNVEYFVSTTTDPNLWFSGGVKNSANVTFVLKAPKGFETQVVDRWDEVRIILGTRPEDETVIEPSPLYPINSSTVKEIWIRDEGGQDDDEYFRDQVEDLAKKMNIPVILK